MTSPPTLSKLPQQDELLKLSQNLDSTTKEGLLPDKKYVVLPLELFLRLQLDQGINLQLKNSTSPPHSHSTGAKMNEQSSTVFTSSSLNRHYTPGPETVILPNVHGSTTPQPTSIENYFDVLPSPTSIPMENSVSDLYNLTPTEDIYSQTRQSLIQNIQNGLPFFNLRPTSDFDRDYEQVVESSTQPSIQSINAKFYDKQLLNKNVPSFEYLSPVDPKYTFSQLKEEIISPKSVERSDFQQKNVSKTLLENGVETFNVESIQPMNVSLSQLDVSTPPFEKDTTKIDQKAAGETSEAFNYNSPDLDRIPGEKFNTEDSNTDLSPYLNSRNTEIIFSQVLAEHEGFKYKILGIRTNQK